MCFLAPSRVLLGSSGPRKWIKQSGRISSSGESRGQTSVPPCLPSCVPGLPLAASPPRASLLAERWLRCITAQRQLGGLTGRRQGLWLTPSIQCKIYCSQLCNFVKSYMATDAVVFWWMHSENRKDAAEQGRKFIRLEACIYCITILLLITILLYYLLLYYYIITFYYNKW